jgi:two-component system, OmpR family, KDP operon response regulator KdpE
MKLLVVDDDPEIGEALRLSFGFQSQGVGQGYQIKTAEDGKSGLTAFFEWRPDLVLLDIGLPEMEGLTVLNRIRECASTPVIMLTARGGDTNIAKALEMGADDYVTKPFSFLELVARIRSQARRLNDSSTASRVEGTFSASGLTIHYATRDVKVDGRAVELTDTEYRLLYHLAQNAGRLMAYRSLLQLVWGSDTYSSDVVRVYISRLRRKIELDPERPRYITTKAGLGYLFTASPETPALAGASSADEGNPN